MKRTIVLVFALALALGLLCVVSLRGDGSADEKPAASVAAVAEVGDIGQNELYDLKSAGCTRRRSGKYWCHLDFVRLASMTRSFNDTTIYITGFLAIDRGTLVLYASEDDFRYKKIWRALRIRGDLDSLRAIASGHLYQHVRMEGVLRANDRADLEAGRLGSLLPPITVRIAEVDDSRPSMDEIRVDYRDIGEQVDRDR